MTFVATRGEGSLDACSQQLARRLGGPVWWTDVYPRSAERYGLRWASAGALACAALDARFAAALRGRRGVVHLSNQHLARYAVLAGLRRPWIVTAHDAIRLRDACGDGPPLIHAPNARDRALLGLDARGIRRAAAVITVSEHSRGELAALAGVPAERIAVVPNGIDHDVFRPADRRALLDGRHVLFVGSEHPRKDLPSALRALALLRREPDLRDVRLLKVGAAGGEEGAFRARTEAVLRELGLGDAVVLAGALAPADVAAAYAGAACLLMPSRHEGFGLPPVEAMACGCPVVAARAGAVPEVVGDAALLVPPGDPAALAAAAARVLRGQAARLRERGLQRAARFTWERAAAGTRAVHEQVLVREARVSAGA